MQNEEIRDLEVRNKIAREEVIKLVNASGISFSHISRSLNISVSSFLHWKGERFDYSFPKLTPIEELIKEYKKIFNI